MEILVSSKVPEELIGWLETELPKSVMSRLQSYIETAKKNPISLNDDLAGNISKSLTLKDKDDWFFKTILLALINKFMQTFPSYRRQVHTFTEGVPFCLDPFWVNFQKENEFNPLHDHSGVFSFVIWIKIPTDWREQHALPFIAASNSPCASDFEFHYTTMLGEIGRHTYCLDKKSEGFMLFFPAPLKHTVYPFYNCDKERISISGNLCLDN
ncbi:uncharacterized protein METZ01_LOCUS155008 [marine metagenome]|uniref:2OG-Fe(II) oxygenase n=1 Tax=marine metagenome TaxID=408172 RepID=A0A382ALA9_9ZZZZ